MAQVAGVLLVLLFIGGTAGFAAHVYNGLKADGILPLPKSPKLTGGKRLSPKAQTQRGRKQAIRTGRTVQVIAAEAITTNWLAKRAHRREHPKPPRQRFIFRSGTLPPRKPEPDGKTTVPADPATPGEPAMPTSVSNPPRDDDAARERSNSYKRSSSGGTTMPTTTSPLSGGASGDFMVSLNRVIAEATGGGIRSKVRATLVMGEGMTQQASALEQYARYLQEAGLYPAYVWEAVLQGAAMSRGCAARLTEAGNAIAEIASRPAGELAGVAPARDELNKA